MIPTFDGQVTIRVKFRSRIDYEKFRKYILKTEWSYAVDYPLFEELVLPFHNTDDLTLIDRQIIGLLQMGFEVYCCRYQLEQTLAEEEHPTEEDPEEPDYGSIDISKIVEEAWKSCGRK